LDPNLAWEYLYCNVITVIIHTMNTYGQKTNMEISGKARRKKKKQPQKLPITVQEAKLRGNYR